MRKKHIDTTVPSSLETFFIVRTEASSSIQRQKQEAKSSSTQLDASNNSDSTMQHDLDKSKSNKQNKCQYLDTGVFADDDQLKRKSGGGDSGLDVSIDDITLTTMTISAEDVWASFRNGYSLLGSGGCGDVLRVEIRGVAYAVKRCDVAKAHKKTVDELKHECYVLRQLNEASVSCVPKLIFSGHVGNFFCMIMNVIEVEGCKRIEQFEEMCVSEAKGCVAALSELHKHRCLHGDIREQNFIVSRDESGNHNDQVFIIDFGFSNFLTQNTSSCSDDDDAFDEEMTHLMTMFPQHNLLEHTAVTDY
jgi:tRNA A-37 threonylcarbamoyl transferase component Bud32